ncbi:WD repeat-containing and planar cell polarity effector protein fritz [Aphomia sociella]
MFNYDIKFLTCDESLSLKNGDFKSFKYETKKRLDESAYDAAKRNYYERRGGHWRAPHSRHIRQLESKIRERGIVLCEWTNETLITIVFSSGAIAYLTVKPSSLDVTQILFDRYCVGKLAGQTVTGVVLSSTHLMFTHTDRTASLITFGKTTVNSVPCRIADRDPHIQSVELGGGSRRTERRVSWCEAGSGVRVLVWSTASAEPAPWSPVIEDHANLHLYQIEGNQMYLKAYHQLENETLSAELTQKQNNIVHIIEQITSNQNGVSLDWARYDISSNSDRAIKLSSVREGGTRVSLPAPARTVRPSPCSMRLLTACIDGSLHVIHNIAGLTHSTKAGFIATDVRWAGELILAVEEGGRLQCFDRALSLLHNHIKCLDLTSHLREPRRMQILATYNATGGPFILATFSGGPLTLLRIIHPRLLTAWLNAGRSSNAVALLRAMDWDEDGAQCLWAVNRIVCAALRSGPAWQAEEASAQAALGAFLAPRAPLAAPAPAAPPLHDLARKFFHHLLRRGRLETALSLAVELAAWDLCSDTRAAAARRRLRALHDEAALLAAHYARLQRPESDCSETCSQCSSHSYSESDVETSGSSEIVKTEPPPLPRVSLPSLPSHPTLMPVTITQTEPISTISIRPNLHQYLERDNTVWNNLRDDTFASNGHDKFKLMAQNVRWNSVDNMLSNHKQVPTKHTLAAISEVPSRSPMELPRVQEDRLASGHFRNLYQTELREEPPSTYRYHNNHYFPSTSMQLRHDTAPPRTTSRSTEKNKVKFSNTVTIAVMSDMPVCSDTERELADSLPLCPPHKYLAAFAPQPAPALPPALPAPPAPPLPPAPAPPPAAPPAAGTALDYVEV